jgi:alpha-glucosidase
VHACARHPRDRFAELRVRFEGGFDLVLRAYDEGVAYRWVLALPDSSVTVVSEEATFNSPAPRSASSDSTARS